MIMVRLLFCTWMMIFTQAFAQIVPGNSGCDLEMQFSIVFYWLISSCLLMILAWDECPGTILMINQHWFRKWLGAVRQQAITWASVDPVLYNHMASIGHHVLLHIIGLVSWVGISTYKWASWYSWNLDVSLFVTCFLSSNSKHRLILNLFSTKLLHFTLNKMCNICKSTQHKTGFFLVFLYAPLLIVIPVTGICNTFYVAKNKRTSRDYIFVMQSTFAPVWSQVRHHSVSHIIEPVWISFLHDIFFSPMNIFLCKKYFISAKNAFP